MKQKEGIINQLKNNLYMYTKKYVTLGILSTLLFIALPFIAFGFRFANLPFYQYQQNLNRNVGIIDRVNNPDRCLGINKEFQELKQEILQVRDVQLTNTKLSLDTFKKSLPEDRTKWGFNDSQAYNQVQSQLTGQQQYLSGLEGKYNAFLNREDTKPCRDNLPTFIALK
jgi:hypothetical protein